MHFVDRDDVWTGWPCTPAPCLVRAITIVAILLASPALADDPESASITAAGDGSFPVPGDDDDDDDNERPRANDDRAVTEETTTLVIDALANDTDPDGDPLRIVDVEQPSHGTAVHDTSRIIYQPAVGFTGNDKFKYVIADPRGATDSATVHVTVEPANRPPVARDDSASTAEDEPVTIAVLANDEDPDGDALTISDVDRPANGSATIVGDQINYAPRAGFSGTDTFDYVVSDGRETSSARVTVQVSSVNDPPQITGQRSLSTPEETALRITLNDLA